MWPQITNPRKEETICATKPMDSMYGPTPKQHSLTNPALTTNGSIVLHAGGLTASLCAMPDGQQALFETPKPARLGTFEPDQKSLHQVFSFTWSDSTTTVCV